jgi:hypothetical protein
MALMAFDPTSMPQQSVVLGMNCLLRPGPAVGAPAIGGGSHINGTTGLQRAFASRAENAASARHFDIKLFSGRAVKRPAGDRPETAPARRRLPGA